MSGELINTKLAIDRREIFEKGSGYMTSKSISELFDVDNTGYKGELEKDLMSSQGVLNALDSISPAVAYAYSHENFRIQTGDYLTESQKVTRDRIMMAINKQLLVDRLQQIDLKKRIDQPIEESEYEELDTDDLREDLKNRQYLNQAEIDNSV